MVARHPNAVHIDVRRQRQPRGRRDGGDTGQRAHRLQRPIAKRNRARRVVPFICKLKEIDDTGRGSYPRSVC